MRIILVRHCKTLFNISGHIMGWVDSPRIENWLEDVLFIEAVLHERDTRPDRVYSSALGRARDTADYISTKLGLGSARHTQQLNEINYGSLSEKPKKWVAAHYPLHKKDPDFVYPDGESFRQMQSRSVSFLQDIALQHPSENVLCVVHAGVIRGLLSHFLHLDFAAQLKRRISHRYVGILDFSEATCRAYDEWGEPSGFVTDGVVTLPQNVA